MAVIGDYYAQTEAGDTKEEPPKWYATSWAPEWALFIVGFGGVWVAISTLNHLRDSSERQLRAYVIPETIGIYEGTMMKPPQPARANVAGFAMLIKNSGQTPAYRVVSIAQITARRVEEESQLISPLPTEHFSNTLGAGGTFSKFLWMDRPLAANEIAEIGTGARAIYVYGRVECRDAFGKARFTNFRLNYVGIFPPPENAIFTFSQSGNDSN